MNASGIIIHCTKTKEGKLPLSAFIEPESFKIYMNDVGLFCNKFAISTNIIPIEVKSSAHQNSQNLHIREIKKCTSKSLKCAH